MKFVVSPLHIDRNLVSEHTPSLPELTRTARGRIHKTSRRAGERVCLPLGALWVSSDLGGRSPSVATPPPGLRGGLGMNVLCGNRVSLMLWGILTCLLALLYLLPRHVYTFRSCTLGPAGDKSNGPSALHTPWNSWALPPRPRPPRESGGRGRLRVMLLFCAVLAWGGGRMLGGTALVKFLLRPLHPNW